MAKTYKGKVVFVDGVHYPVKDDHADLERPLRVNEEGDYRDAEEGEELHNDTHHQREALVISEPIIAQAGEAIYPAGIHVIHRGDGFYYIENPDGTVEPNALRWDAETETFRSVGGDN